MLTATLTRLFGILALCGCSPLEEVTDALPRSTSIETTLTPAPTTPEEVTCQRILAIEWISEIGGVPLSDGDPVTLVHGSQGGWHIALDAGIAGSASKSVLVGATVERLATGEQLAGEDNDFGLPLFDWAWQTCEGELRGMVAYLDDLPGVTLDAICRLVGQELSVTLTVEDIERSTPTERTIRVVARADPEDPCL